MGSLLTLLRRRRVSGGFSPADIAGLQLWLDASDTSTITESGGAVSQWDDKSGNGNHVVQATAAAQPTTGVATQNGLNVLDFDGTDVLAKANPLLPGLNSARTAIVVSIRTGGNYVFSYGTAATNQTFALDLTTPTQRVVGFANDWVTGQPGNTSWEVAVAWHDETNVRYQVNRGTLRGPDARTYNTTTANLYIGRFTFSTGYFTGEIAEILIYDSALSTVDRERVESYMASKWGITLA